MKTTKIMVCCAIMGILSFPAFAGPNRGCGGCHPPCPPRPCRPCHPCRPHYHHHCCGGGSSGVRLAADIVSLVGASLNVIRGPVYPAAVVSAPAVQPAYPVYNNGYVPMQPVYR